jgi:hypothetical protein
LPPLFVEEAGKARRRPELEGFRALLAGNLDCLPKERLGVSFRLVRSEGPLTAALTWTCARVGLKRQRSFQPIQLCLEEAFSWTYPGSVDGYGLGFSPRS